MRHMIGFINKKYHVAILDVDENIISKIVNTLKSWYSNRIVIEKFTDPRELFEAINVNEIKNRPFDVAVLSPEEEPEKMILKHSNPSLKVVICKDEQTLKKETGRILI